MSRQVETPRNNQRHRTRKDLLAAAARLLKQGRPFDMDQVAAEALVSRATAYRYFPSVEALLIEAPLDGAVPDPDELFKSDSSSDPVERLDKAEAALHAMCYRNEQQLRALLVASLERSLKTADHNDIPLRQNRRSSLIAAALAPARSRFNDSEFERLSAALGLVFGTESMIVFSDVLGIDEKSARQIKRWTIHALVDAALRQTTA